MLLLLTFCAKQTIMIVLELLLPKLARLAVSSRGRLIYQLDFIFIKGDWYEKKLTKR